MAFWASKDSMWKGCQGVFHRLGLGMDGNISNLSIVSDKFYQLPSGDKIPAVALGMLKCRRYRFKLTDDGRRRKC